MARTRPPRERTPAPPPATKLTVSQPSLPPLLRDPWALLVALAVLPVLVSGRATPMGEPFSDDLLFLDFSVIRGNPSWWDGGGGVAYWRPLARQAYYGLLGPLMLSHPAVVAALHALALAAAGVLLMRALRPAWPAPAAAAAAAFPLLMEPARTLLAWPSGAQDLGALLFLALALHAAARRRVALLAAAGVAAALCKEVAAPLALLVALAPFPRPAAGHRRAPAVTAGALAVWAVLRFALPHFAADAGLSALVSPRSAALPIASRFSGGLALAARDAFGLFGAPAWAPVAAIAAVGVPLLAVLLSPGGRSRAAWPWSVWGAAWFVMGAAPLALFLPEWASFRSVLPAAGLGIALVAPLVAARAAWLLPLAAIRLVALLLAPQPPERLQVDASASGDALSFPRLAQLQRAVRGVRTSLRAGAPRLAPGARVMREGWPRMTGVAFAGDRSLQLWYRDTTLRWVTAEALAGPASAQPVAMIEFEPHRLPQFAFVNRAALSELAVAQELLKAGRWAAAIAALDSTEALQRDTTAARFRANLAGWRASCLYDSGNVDGAQAQAGIAMGRYVDTPNGRFTLAQVHMTHGDWEGAARLFQEHLARYPEDADARELLAEARKRLAPED